MKRVVVVEDNDVILDLFTRALDEPDIAMSAGGADVTQLMYEQYWDDVDVAVVDLLLPGTVGDELITWLEANAPHVKRVAVSGAGPVRLAKVTNAHVQMLKPFMIDDLLAAIRAERP